MGRVSVISAPQTVAAELEERLPCLDSVVVHGCLKNSESLSKLHVLLGHLPESERADLSEIIRAFLGLFEDIPTQTHLIEHDIDVGEAQPIRQRFYCVNPEMWKYLDAEVMLIMLDHGIAEPLLSSWASPCLVVPKSDNTPRFCTDFRKVNAVMKPDSFLLPRMEDCVDQMGHAKYVSKFDLLKAIGRSLCPSKRVNFRHL